MPPTALINVLPLLLCKGPAGGPLLGTITCTFGFRTVSWRNSYNQDIELQVTLGSLLREEGIYNADNTPISHLQ